MWQSQIHSLRRQSRQGRPGYLLDEVVKVDKKPMSENRISVFVFLTPDSSSKL